MKTPIIAHNRGDILLFETVARAERYMEPIDVKNNEYEVYDADGLVLIPSVSKERRMFGWHEFTVLRMSAPPQRKAEELRAVLSEYLSAVTTLPQPPESCTLEQLIALSLPFGKTE